MMAKESQSRRSRGPQELGDQLSSLSCACHANEKPERCDFDNRQITSENSLKITIADCPSASQKEEPLQPQCIADIEVVDQAAIDNAQPSSIQDDESVAPSQTLASTTDTDITNTFSKLTIQPTKSFFWSQHSMEDWDIYNDDSNIPSQPHKPSPFPVLETFIFFSFSRLPRALRDRIWSLHIPFPPTRLLEINYQTPALQLHSTLLSLCPETRTYFYRHYKPIFRPLPQLSFQPCMVFNPEIDTLLIDLSIETLQTYSDMFSSEVLSEVKYLAFSGYHAPFDRNGGIYIGHLQPLLNFRKLQRIALVVCDSWNEGFCGEAELYHPFTWDLELWDEDLQDSDVAGLVVDEAVGSAKMTVVNVKHLQTCLEVLRRALWKLLEEEVERSEMGMGADGAGAECEVWMMPEVVVRGVRRV